MQMLSRSEGIIPALEPSHAIYYGMQLASKMRPEQSVLINCCGRGDKDMITVAKALVSIHVELPLLFVFMCMFSSPHTAS
jgi:tryptophan synthase beta subunit